LNHHLVALSLNSVINEKTLVRVCNEHLYNETVMNIKMISIIYIFKEYIS
jgi:hypothetical protein